MPIGDVPYIQEGWKCPQCGKINAPFVRSCDCSHYVSEPWRPYPSPWLPYDPWVWEKWVYPWPKITWNGDWSTSSWVTTGTTYIADDGSTTIEYG